MHHENSHRLFTQAQRVFPGGVNSPVRAFRSVGGEPFVVERGEGPYLIDVDGNRYVDYICSWGPLVVGHAHPAVVEAITAQTKKGTSYGASSAMELKLAEKVMGMMPNLEMMRFVSSGTEATMHAIRVCRGFTGREKILKFDGCYHGASDPLLAKAGSGVATLGLPDSAGVPANVVQNTLTATFNSIAEVKAIFERYPNEIAVVVLEPVVGNSGLILPKPHFLQELREITARYGALLMFDEVMTGFRVHLGGAQALFGIKPDIMALGKVIGGGLPVAAYGGRRDIMEKVAPLGPVYQAGTLSGNPVGMAAGLATLEEWTKPGVFERAAKVASTVVQALRESSHAAGIPLIAESVGTMFGFFFQAGPVETYDDAKRSDVGQFKKFFHEMLRRGVYFAPSQFEAAFVSVTHEGAPLDHTVKAIQGAFQTLRA